MGAHVEPLASDVLDLLQFLLPGFITTWVYYGLTPFKKPQQYERIIHALVWTTLIAALVTGVRWAAMAIGEYWSLGPWSEDSRVVVSVPLALGLGLFAARSSNCDTVHGFLRDRGITNLTSYASVWYGAMKSHKGYVVLELKGGRRLYGWPEEWPNHAGEDCFSLAEPAWIVGAQGATGYGSAADEQGYVPLEGTHRLLVPASEVEFVELLTSPSHPAPVQSMKGECHESQATSPSS